MKSGAFSGAIVALSMGLSAACGTDAPSANADVKALVEAIVERGWNQGETDVFSSTIADSVTFHYAGSTRAMTRNEMSDIVLRWREAFPDLQMEIKEIIAEGEIVASRLTLSGTHEGRWRDAPPTGKKVTMALAMFFRFEDGELTELWESDDQLGFQRQLGIIP